MKALRTKLERKFGKSSLQKRILIQIKDALPGLAIPSPSLSWH